MTSERSKKIQDADKKVRDARARIKSDTQSKRAVKHTDIRDVAEGSRDSGYNRQKAEQERAAEKNKGKEKP